MKFRKKASVTTYIILKKIISRLFTEATEGIQFDFLFLKLKGKGLLDPYLGKLIWWRNFYCLIS